MKAFKSVKYALAGAALFLSLAGAVKGKSLDKVVAEEAGRTVRVKVLDDFNNNPLDSALVKFVCQNDTSIAYNDTTNSSGMAEFEDFNTSIPDDTDVPLDYKLKQNYPNPFNPSTTIPIDVDKYTDVNLSIYNIRGQLVKTLYDGNLEPGEHYHTWDGTDNSGTGVAAGVYIAMLDNGESIKMMLLDGNTNTSMAPKVRLKKTNNDMDAGRWYDVDVSRNNYESLSDVVFVEEGEGAIEFVYKLTRNNEEPVIKAEVTPKEAAVGDTVTFSDLGSYDPDNDPINYEWITEGQHYFTSDAKHAYDAKGEKTVTFKVTDERGASSDTSFTVTVSELERIAQGLVTDITNDSLLYGQPVSIAGKTDTTDVEGNFSIGGLEPGTYRIKVGTGTDYRTMERDVTITEDDTTKVGPQRLVPNKPGLTEFLDGTVFAEKGWSEPWGKYTQKWAKKADSVCVNIDHMNASSQQHAETFMTDPDLASSTYGVHDYTAQEIHKVGEDERPDYGTPGTFIWEFINSTPFAAVYENPQNRGKIDATVVNIPNGTDLATAYHEGLTAITGIDEVIEELEGKYESARNETTTTPYMSDKDIIINKFNQDRDHNTLEGDIGPSSEAGLAKAAPGKPIIIYDGKVVGDEDLTPSQISAYHTLLENSVRPPTYVIFN
ncbi:MAG: PKD domain-containing protein [bacterium]